MWSSFNHILIIEPDSNLHLPYRYLDTSFTIQRLLSVEAGLEYFQSVALPDLVFLSASYEPTEIIQLLEALKNVFTTRIVPVIFVINFQHRLSVIPGTNWGGKVGVLHSLSSPTELNSTL